MTDKQAKILYCVLAVPMICLIAWGSVWFVEKQDKRKAKSAIKATEERIEAKEKAKEKAKIPAKIYRGTYNNGIIEIKEYHPVR